VADVCAVERGLCWGEGGGTLLSSVAHVMSRVRPCFLTFDPRSLHAREL